MFFIVRGGSSYKDSKETTSYQSSPAPDSHMSAQIILQFLLLFSVIHKDFLRFSTIFIFYPFSCCYYLVTLDVGKLLDLPFRLKFRPNKKLSSFQEAKQMCLQFHYPYNGNSQVRICEPLKGHSKAPLWKQNHAVLGIAVLPVWASCRHASFLQSHPTLGPGVSSHEHATCLLFLAPSFDCSVYFFHILTLFQFQAK